LKFIRDIPTPPMIALKSLTRATIGIVLVNAVVAGAASAAPFTFVFPNLNTSPNPLTQNSFSVSSSGYTLTVSSPVGGPFPAAGGTNSTANGLCVWAQNGSGGGDTRCGLVDPPADTTSNLTGLSFSFSKPVILTGLTVSQFDNLNSGSLQIGSSPAVNFTGVGFNPLSDVFVNANTPISLASLGNLAFAPNSGIIRLSSLQFKDGVPVPGPLPLLGAATAFTFSRRLRKKIKSNSLL
jgi:hypothetical protein